MDYRGLGSLNKNAMFYYKLLSYCKCLYAIYCIQLSSYATDMKCNYYNSKLQLLQESNCNFM